MPTEEPDAPPAPVEAPAEAELEVPAVLIAWAWKEDGGLPNEELRDIDGERDVVDDDVRLVSLGMRSVRLLGSELFLLPFPDMVAVACAQVRREASSRAV